MLQVLCQAHRQQNVKALKSVSITNEFVFVQVYNRVGSFTFFVVVLSCKLVKAMAHTYCCYYRYYLYL